ncbi:hypothetical protein ACWEV3_10990 [Saccharopolyspora sp. NPDC003752]
MLGERWTDYDGLVLDSMGIDGTDLVLGTGPAPRSEIVPERVLQAAADGELQVSGLDEGWEIVRVYLDQRPVTVREQEYINELITEDHLVIIGTRIALTAFGRETLARWSKNSDLKGKRGEQ